MKIAAANTLFSSYMNLIVFDHEAENAARLRFHELQRSGVIKMPSSFSDLVWQTTDEYSNVGIHFKFNQVLYRKNWEDIFQISFSDFLLCVKCFTVSLFNRSALSSISTTVLDLRHIISTDPDAIYSGSEELAICHPFACSDFIATIPGHGNNKALSQLAESMDLFSDRNFDSMSGRQRELSELDTYFVFDQILKDYWSSSIPHKERMFYYPLYLWWMITAVIPLRPREFLLTQRNCLERDHDGNYWLTIRRNNLKGNRKNIAYKLPIDYREDTYHIPDALGKEIESYIKNTEGYDSTDIDTLFVTDPHYSKWKQKKHDNSRFLTYINMTTILRYFYSEIIMRKYGYTILYDSCDRYLDEKEICRIHLGDTRHISLVNLMEEGGTPALAMVLAGHSDINTSAHYYSNVKKFIECKTYRQYRKLLAGNVRYQISPSAYLPKAVNGIILKCGGKCTSKLFEQSVYTDCIATAGPNGEIGYCPDCVHYRPAAGSGLVNEDIYLKNLKTDCNALRDAVEYYRREKGSAEEIGQALGRLQASSISYQQYLLEKQQQMITN